VARTVSLVCRLYVPLVNLVLRRVPFQKLTGAQPAHPDTTVFLEPPISNWRPALSELTALTVSTPLVQLAPLVTLCTVCPSTIARLAPLVLLAVKQQPRLPLVNRRITAPLVFRHQVSPAQLVPSVVT